MNDRPAAAIDTVAPVAASRVQAVPRVRPVMQMLLPTEGKSEDGRRFAMRSVLDWAAEKWAGLIPRGAWDGEDFEHDEPGLELGVVNLPEKGLWGFRVEHPDTTVPGRVWLLEALVASADVAFDALGVRSQCSASESGDIPTSSPRFLRTWLDRIAVLDAARPLSSAVWDVDARQTETLVRLLRDPARQLPVVIESQQPAGDWLSNGAWSPALARRTVGLAHVVRVPSTVASELAEVLGREFAVFNGAVRTYLPGFGLPGDSQVHINVLPARIRNWRTPEGEGPGAFLEFLVAQMHRISVATPERLEQMPSYVQLRKFKAERDRTAQVARIQALQKQVAEGIRTDLAADLEVLRAQLEEKKLELEIRALEKEDAEKKAADAEALFNEQAADLSAIRDERDTLRATVSSLRAGLAALRTSRGEPERLPTSYEEVADWVDRSLSDRLFLLQRARRSLKAAVFNELSLVINCLKLLANEYWLLRTCDQESHAAAKLAFETRLQQLGVDEAPSISSVSLGKLEEHYTVSYAIGHTSKQVLDRHLRGGSNTKDDRFCLRIYFLWDDEQQKVVVGHLPSHLDTLAT